MSIVYSRRGSGDPLVLVHGIGHRKEAWRPVLDTLAEHHDVVALDLPGFGASGTLPGTNDDGMDVFVDALEKLFADLGIPQPHVVGNSLGGAIALELAARGSVRTATALSPAGFWTTPGRWSAVATLLAIKGAASLPMPVLRGTARSRWTRGAAMSALFAHPTRISHDDFLGDVRALRECTAFGRVLKASRTYQFAADHLQSPTTVAWAANDRVLRPSQAQRARAQLPGATHVMLPDCGHVPMIDHPEIVSRVILHQTRRAA